METKLCKCGHNMIKQSTGIVHLTYPPQYPMIWKCACGNTEEAETVRGKTDEDVFMELWRRVNPAV